MVLQIRRVCGADAVATLGPVGVRVVRTAPTALADIDEAKQIFDELLEGWPVIGALIVVHHGAPVPTGPVRRYARKAFGSYGDRLIMSHVMLGLGFWAAAGRAAVKTITGWTGHPAPLESTVEAGAERLSTELIGVDPATLIAAHDQLLAQMQVSGTSVA